MNFIHSFFYNLQNLPKGGTKKDIHIAVRAALSAKKGEFDRTREKDYSKSHNSDDGSNIDDDGESFDARMRMQILKKRQERGDVTTREKPQKGTHYHINSTQLVLVYFLSLPNV